MSTPSEFKRGWHILLLAFVGVATSAAVMPWLVDAAFAGSVWLVYQRVNDNH